MEKELRKLRKYKIINENYGLYKGTFKIGSWVKRVKLHPVLDKMAKVNIKAQKAI